MRGLLSFTILYLLAQREMYGAEVAAELARRRGDRPTPGTLYPALKKLESRGLIVACSGGKTKCYALTPRGRAGLAECIAYFDHAYGDILEAAHRIRAIPRSRKARRPASG